MEKLAKFGVVREWGGGRESQESKNKTILYVSIIGESTTSYESSFDSNRLQSVYLQGKSSPV